MALLRTCGCFDAIRRSKPLRLQMLAVGCAVGVSSTFGAPIGGVLFSIEGERDTPSRTSTCHGTSALSREPSC